jgi:sugar lactone lactonase YvrE
VIAPTGDILVVDTGNSRIRKVGRNGIITTVAGNGVTGFTGDGGDPRSCALNRPVGAALAPDGSLWIADTFNNRVRRIAGFAQQFLE